MTIRIGCTSSAGETLTGNNHLFICSIHFEMCTAPRNSAWSQIKVILTERRLLTLSFVEGLACLYLSFISVCCRNVCACISGGTWLFLKIYSTVVLLQTLR